MSHLVQVLMRSDATGPQCCKRALMRGACVFVRPSFSSDHVFDVALMHQDGDEEGKLDKPALLEYFDGWAYYRFDLRFTLDTDPRKIVYSVDAGDAGKSEESIFWLPHQSQSWHWGYYSVSEQAVDRLPCNRSSKHM